MSSTPAITHRAKSSSEPLSLRLLTAEKWLCAFGLLALLLYQAFDLELRDPGRIYLQRIVSCTFLYGLGLIVCLGRYRLRDLRVQMRQAKEEGGTLIPWRTTTARFREYFFARERFIFHLRSMNVVACMFCIYVQLKNLIPRVNPALYDELFVQLEGSWFGGVSPTLLLQSYFGVESAWFWSECYTLYYPYLAALVFVVMLGASVSVLEHFLTAFVATWFVGILIVYLCPTLGPCFFDPTSVAALPYTEVTKLQEHLIEHKLFIEQNPFSDKGVYLISGLPSLHIAIVALGTYYLWFISRPLMIGSLLLLSVTFVSTIYFGWHYCVDDVAAVSLAALAVLIANVTHGNLSRLTG